MIPFNKLYLSGNETEYIRQAVESGKISGDGVFTKKCHNFFKNKYSFNKCLLTTSCTDALEMASVLCNILPGDEVIMPSYTFVSTSNPFVLKGARIIFADSCEDNPNMDAHAIEKLVTKKTKVIIPVHYAGVACDMDPIMELSRTHNLFVIEDAAQAIDSYYKQQPLGGIGHLGAFSFHETKNIVSGEGGALVVNKQDLLSRSEIIWEKGTNRAAFYRGEVDKYGWVDVGSSFLPSEIIAAFLLAQMECIDSIQKKRVELWRQYYEALSPLAKEGYFKIPVIPDYATNNGHIFYLVCNSNEERSALIDWLKKKGIHAVFHYLALHCSPFYIDKHDGRVLPNADHFSNCLVRLPMYYELSEQDIGYVVESIIGYYKKSASKSF